MNGLRLLRLLTLIALSIMALVLPLGPRAVNSRDSNQRAGVRAIIEQHCFACHGATGTKGGLNLEKLLATDSVGEHFQEWERVVAVLDQQTMPPKGMPAPDAGQRRQVMDWIRQGMDDYARRHDGNPGEVTVRRLTSGEYFYTIGDLTGIRIDTARLGIDTAADSVGGEGFANFGDVQFMQDATLERYLTAARRIADHAVIGAGPLEFYPDPGKTGLELAAIERIRDIYAESGFRTVSGEGGRPFGLEKYGKALFVAWQYRHRVALGKSGVRLATLAAAEGISLQFASHLVEVLEMARTGRDLGHPLTEAVARWERLPVPGPTAARQLESSVRTQCTEIQQYLVTWPSWLFARGDVAAGGAGDESPLEFTDRTLNVESTQRFNFRPFNIEGEKGRRRLKVFLNVAAVNPRVPGEPVIIWRKVGLGKRLRPTGPPVSSTEPAVPLHQVIAAETAQRLRPGSGPDGLVLGPDDFVSTGSVMVEFQLPESIEENLLEVRFEAELAGNRDHVARVLVADRADGRTRGQPTRFLLGDMKSAGYRAFRAGVSEYVRLTPPNSHGEPTPADKDPIPDPFDNTYNVPEHDEFVQKVKYIRDDRFVVDRLIDPATRRKLDQAWMNLYASFEYHDNYLRLLASHYRVDLRGDGIERMTPARIAQLPEAMRQYVTPLKTHYDEVMAAQLAARPGHLRDSLDFAARAWRRPLTVAERQGLRDFYARTIATDGNHPRAIRALLARILVAPQFLYRVEPGQLGPGLATAAAAPRELGNWEMASRLSFFLWSSVPDAALRRAAAAGELTTTAGIEREVRRMLADPKARRLATEFFGQWLGFYNFDQYKGVDTSRFTDFTDEVRQSMYEEALTFFEHVVRRDRPVNELFFADYTFLNRQLAGYYGVRLTPGGGADRLEQVQVPNRGGLLRLGAILTVTSAPLRTSPVKRGDWLLRRILGTPVPPPPANAGSIPADDKQFGGLTLKARLDQHKRNASCASCHTRIDPLGFALERYDPTGRWRDQYLDGQSIDDSGELSNRKVIAGTSGLLDYLRSREPQVRRNLSYKLIGYALGRTVLASDRSLVERMVGAGGEASFSTLAAQIATSRQFRTRL
jgi:mono/diheme cytochrome c family protein